MDEQRIDGVARMLATGGASRRRLVRTVVGAALGFSALATAKATGAACRGDYCRNKVQRCGSAPDCRCYRRPDGGSVCAGARGDCRFACATDQDCENARLSRFKCVRNGVRCCGAEFANICAEPCRR